MPHDLPDSIRRLTALYERGLLTQHECAHRLLDLFADESDERITDAFSDVPDSLIPRLRSELHELANADYYLRWFGIGETRTEDQIHADALTRQPKLRRVCRVIRPLVLVRSVE